MTAPAGGGWLSLVGTEGLLRGESVFLREGQAIVFGRGAGSTFPLTRTAAYRRLTEDPAALRRACQGVSRRHLVVRAAAPGEAEVEDLSRAGTMVDGRRIDGPVRLRDLRDRAHQVRFGKGECLELRWHDVPAGA